MIMLMELVHANLATQENIASMVCITIKTSLLDSRLFSKLHLKIPLLIFSYPISFVNTVANEVSNTSNFNLQ